jgi:hypothetical protein
MALIFLQNRAFSKIYEAAVAKNGRCVSSRGRLWHSWAMAHFVDGFDLTFTSRTSWKATRRLRGKVIDIVPVTWTKGLRQPGPTLEVWYRNPEERQGARQSREPFVVAVARAKDYSALPHEFEQFTALFRVVATGDQLSETSIETKVLERVRAS